MPDRPAPVPDEVLREIAEIPARVPEPGMSALVEAIAAERRAIAREVLALRAWARGACAWLECASTGAVVDLPATNVPQTAAEGRSLLPEPPEAP